MTIAFIPLNTDSIDEIVITSLSGDVITMPRSIIAILLYCRMKAASVSTPFAQNGV
jgi:hypothetical protein